MVVEHMSSTAGPDITKEADIEVQPSHSVSSQESDSFLASKSKIIFEEVHCHVTVSDSIWMTLLLRGFVRFIAKVCAILSSGLELDSPVQDDLETKHCTSNWHLSYMTVLHDNLMFRCLHCIGGQDCC